MQAVVPAEQNIKIVPDEQEIKMFMNIYILMVDEISNLSMPKRCYC